MGNSTNKLHPKTNSLSSPRKSSKNFSLPSKRQKNSSKTYNNSQNKLKKKPKNEPKPIKGSVNPEGSIIQNESNTSEFVFKEIIRNRLLRIMMPSYQFKGYKIIKLKEYCDDKCIYSVVDSENNRKILIQYKFHDVEEANLKCRTLSLISKLNLRYFTTIIDFFLEIEEIDYHSFFYLNLIIDSYKVISLSELLIFFQKKAKLDEPLLWDLFNHILSPLVLLYQNRILLQNIDFNKISFVLPKKKNLKEEENPQFWSLKLMKLLKKGFMNNCQIIFFNKSKYFARKKKEIKQKTFFLKKVLKKQPLFFDPFCFNSLSANPTKAFLLETTLFNEISKIFFLFLSFITSLSFSEVTKRSFKSLERLIESLEYSFPLKFLFKKACLYNFNLPRSLNHIFLTYQVLSKTFQEMAAIEASIEENRNIETNSLNDSNIHHSFLYYFRNDFLILTDPKPQYLKTPHLLILNISSLKPNEILSFYPKTVAWNQKNHFFICFEKDRKKNEGEQIYLLEIDIKDISSKLEDNKYTFLDELDKKPCYSIEEFIEFSQNYSISEIVYEKQQGVLKVSGFDSIKQKIQFFSINLKTKGSYLIKEISIISSTSKIIDFWVVNQELWLWKQSKLTSYNKDLIEIHNLEKNTISSIEIGSNAYSYFSKNEIITNPSEMAFFTRPLMLKNRVLAFVGLGNNACMGVKGLFGEIIDFSEAKVIDLEGNCKELGELGSLRNQLVLNEENEEVSIYRLSGHEEIFLDFFELDERLQEVSFQNTVKLWILPKKNTIINDTANDDNNMENQTFLMDEFLFNQYKIKHCTDQAECFEIFDEPTGKILLIYKRKQPLITEKLNTSSHKANFKDSKFFFDLSSNPKKLKKLLYLPKTFYLSPNVVTHQIELWLFLEKKEKTLYEYLEGYRDSREYDALAIIETILTNYLKLDGFNVVLNEKITLDNIIIVKNEKKNKMEFKFDVMSQEEKSKIAYYFIYFNVKEETKNPFISDLLQKIDNNDTKKFGFLLLFVCFPRFVKKTYFDEALILKILRKIKADHKFYNEEAIDLIEKLIFPENSNDLQLNIFKTFNNNDNKKNISSLLQQISYLRSLSSNDLIQSALNYKRIFSENNPLKTLFFIEPNFSLLLKFNFFSKELRKYTVFYKGFKYNINNIIAFCCDYNKNLIFAVDEVFFFFSIDVSCHEKENYNAEALPKNQISTFENKKDFQPNCLIFFQEKIYQIGGVIRLYRKDQGCSECVCYDPNLRKWDKIANLALPRKKPGVSCSKDYIFVFGGAEDQEFHQRNKKLCFEKYDPIKDRWEQIYLRNLQQGQLDFFYQNLKFVSCLDFKKTFLFLNLQFNKIFIVILEKEKDAVLFEAKIGEPFLMLKALEEQELTNKADTWAMDKMIILNKNAQICFVENGKMFFLKIHENEKELKVFWDDEVLIWELVR